MRRLGFLALALGLAATSASAQSLAGLRIGDPVAATARFGPPSDTGRERQFDVRKWTFPNGNDLSVTSDATGRIVYVETDWGGRAEGVASGVPGLRFGGTTLSELRQRFGSNGVAYQGRSPVIRVDDGIALLNSWDAGASVVTLITKVRNPTSPNIDVGATARLDAISLSDPAYLTGLYGERVLSPGYRAVAWPTP